MKKYLIQFMCVDMPSIEDDGVCGGTNFGVHKQAFNSREEAEKNLKECYGLNAEDFELTVEISVEDGTHDRK